MDALRKNKTNLIFLFGLEEQRFVSIYQECFKFIDSSMDTVLSYDKTGKEKTRNDKKRGGERFRPLLSFIVTPCSQHAAS